VERNLDELIPYDVKTAMDEYEIFLLLLSVFLHDIGIMCAANTEEENQKIRENHHERSRQYVKNNLQDLLSPPERHVVGEICLAHRECVELKTIEETKMIRHQLLGNKEVRVRFLAALLRLADSCDICHTRTTEELSGVAKLPENAKFFHTLHERVSGIGFDEKSKTIRLDFNVASNKEKPICVEYVVNGVQNHLNSVRDCLIRNGVIYIDVMPRFSITNISMSQLKKPKITREKKEPVARNILSERRAIILHRKKEYEKSLKICDLALKRHESAYLWYLKGLNFSELKNNIEAGKCFERSTVLEPKNDGYANMAGHFIGEVLLDTKKSFKLFEKAYQNNPDLGNTINYAEALVTVGKAQEGYNLANKVLSESDNIHRIINAYFIKVYSLFFMGKKEEESKELCNFALFFNRTPSSAKERNPWVYHKIRKCIETNIAQKTVKDILTKTIDLLELKISSEDFEKELGKFLTE
jgi:tetratricopeptide (TPR) repeat protein